MKWQGIEMQESRERLKQKVRTKQCRAENELLVEAVSVEVVVV